MAIAQAVIEYVHHIVGSKALVSTHFHELAHLEETLPSLANACMAVQETGDNVTFLRKLVPGAASSSYGIYCAQVAGLPDSIIARAYTLLESHVNEQEGLQRVSPPTTIEDKKELIMASVREAAPAYDQAAREKDPIIETSLSVGGSSGPAAAAEVVQLSIFSEPVLEQAKARKASPRAEHVADQLKRLDLFNMTPMQAMHWLNEMKLKLMEDK